MQLINQKVHFVGIKGIGISALAQFFAGVGARVTGSDGKEKFPADAILRRLRIPVNPFSPKNISPKLDLVIYSSAYNQNNHEIKKAVKLGIPLKSYGEALAEVFNGGENKIVVAGSHGKTTTTALTGHLLSVAGFKPTVFLGGISNNWQGNFKKGLPAGRHGGNKWLVAEGDEYQKKFLFLKPDYLLITNIDFDHPDCFKNKKEYRRAFEELKNQTARKVLLGAKISPKFRKFLAKIDFPLLGEKNKENAFLVYKLAKELKITEGKIKIAFETFKGTKRRMECVGRQVSGVKFQVSSFKIYDDYAHHPEEIKATLSAIKEKYPDYKILSIFQPHTFSRTQALLKEFGRCFKKADFVYLLSTFASAREQNPRKNIDEILLKEVKKHHPQARFFSGSPASEHSDILKNIGIFLRNNDKNKIIILLLGAGDVYKIAEKLNLK